MNKILFTLCLCLISMFSKAQALPSKNVNMHKQLVYDFVKAINDHDAEKISILMTDNHKFIDAHGNEVVGREKMKEGWMGYFQWFPDYKIEISNLLSDGDTLAAFGFAEATFQNKKTVNNKNYWRLPVAWKIIIAGNKIRLWQVFADTKIPFDIMNTPLAGKQADTLKEKKVTGIGGVFFKSKEPKKLKEWYKTHLGLDTDQYGTNFEWRQSDDPNKKGYTQWSPFKETTQYFAPSTKDFMINYRVDNLEALVSQFRKDGITILDTLETYEYGKFIHIIDPEGNKIELWEPLDIEYDKIVTGRTK